jgi:hypothetical protein
MQSSKSIPGEEAYIGEDILASSAITALERKCFVVKQTVTDNDFTLEEALEAYGVSKEDFESYFAKQLVSEFKIFLHHSSSKTFAITGSIAVIGNIYKELLAPVDEDSNVVQGHLRDLSTDIQTGKIRV